jgi:3-deoxy-7-phosphoheptulonate synthase
VVVVMEPGATGAHVDAVVERVRGAGGEAFVSRGVSRTIIGLVGDDVDAFRALNLRSMTGVADVIRVSSPLKLVSLDNHPGRSTVVVGGPDRGVPIGPGTFTLIAGPCAVESAQQTFEAAEMAQAAGATLLRGGAFKPRTSPYAFQGLGTKGLEILAEAREQTGLPIVTELLDPRDVEEVAAVADIIQIGARNMHNFNLLAEVGRVPKPVLLKRAPSATVEELLMAAEYVAKEGNERVLLCERGIKTFERSTRFTLDLSAVPVLKRETHLPVLVDPSHAAGRSDLVLPLARAAIAAGADGVMIEVHPQPEDALCDGPQQIRVGEFARFADEIRTLVALMGKTVG